MRIAIAALMALMVSGLAGAAHAQPGGSYLRSCTDVQMRGNTLMGVCRRGNGRMESSVLPDVNRCAGGVANENGELTCNNGALRGSSRPAFAEPYPYRGYYRGRGMYSQPYGPEEYNTPYGSEEYNRPYGPNGYYPPYGPR